MRYIFKKTKASKLVQFSLRHKHLIKFLMIGCLNTTMDLGLFFIFSNILSIQPVVASILSTGITMCFSFYFNHTFVFESNKNKKDTVLQFVIATAFNVWVIQSLVIAFVIHLLKNNSHFINHTWTLNITAKLCGIAVSFVLNFIMYRSIFHRRRDNAVAL